MADAPLPDEALRRPWHGASDRAEDPAVAVLRLQRAEVEAMMAYRRAPEATEEQARAWRRLATLREKRMALMPTAEAARLPPLPPGPARGLTAWQKLRRRLGLMREPR
ncbi:hypothetical protein J5Y09_04495 [Roseomonas sp. PWR1]|uniref:Uncharacterized protein n=1 Tax=Roseomonas nitratireducens TaxID=2820810 RepID=A0ABS4AP76_9PROT|nr:hypothetical protein [Neoroseomonas nitratireducens]MBP0463160.1 hypothetical protein [Neoroseomonas nitratireducens]